MVRATRNLRHTGSKKHTHGFTRHHFLEAADGDRERAVDLALKEATAFREAKELSGEATMAATLTGEKACPQTGVHWIERHQAWVARLMIASSRYANHENFSKYFFVANEGGMGLSFDEAKQLAIAEREGMERTHFVERSADDTDIIDGEP